MQPLPMGAVKVEAAYTYADLAIQRHRPVLRHCHLLSAYSAGYRWLLGTHRLRQQLRQRSVFAEWFVTENIALSVEYSDTETLAGFRGVDGDAFLGSALIRF